MKNRLKALVLFSLITITGNAKAQDEQKNTAIVCSAVKTSLQFQKCILGLSDSLDKELSKSFKQLSEQIVEYETLNSKPKNSSLASLKATQASWLNFRENNCSFYKTLTFSQDDANVGYNACKLRMTAERMQELENEKSFFAEQGYTSSKPIKSYLTNK
jgi:uncharacterized protein YecT (DUF1311 family)